jgi:hypothetical protein
MGEYMGSGIGLGDAMILANRNGGNGQWDNHFMYLVWLAVLGNGGLGGFGGGNGALTRADLTMGFNDQDTRAGIRGIQQGICDGFYAVNTGMLNGFNGVTSAISNCCCETNRNIDAVRYENSRNTCDIVNAIHGEGEVTRALINANTMDALREKVNEKDRELQSAQFQLSQLSQNATIINALRPTPIPAYLTCSPFTSYGGNGCGCGCGGYAA